MNDELTKKIDRRKFPRLAARFRVDLLNMGDDPMFGTDQAVIEAESLDISKQGLRIKTSYNVSVKSNLSVIVYHKRHQSVALCQVVWKREMIREFVYGLYIKEWSELDKDLLARLNSLESDRPPHSRVV